MTSDFGPVYRAISNASNFIFGGVLGRHNEPSVPSAWTALIESYRLVYADLEKIAHSFARITFDWRVSTPQIVSNQVIPGQHLGSDYVERADGRLRRSHSSPKIPKEHLALVASS